MLAMLEPITFPKEMSLKPSTAACTLTNNSGAEVAKETTVRPMIIFESFSFKDSPTAALTKKSPPITNKPRPIKINSMLIYVVSVAKINKWPLLIL